MDRLNVFIEEFKKRSKELNIDKRTCDLVKDIYNTIDKDCYVNHLDVCTNMFSIDSYCVLRHFINKNVPMYYQGIFVTTFNKFRKVLGVPTYNNKINEISFIEWHFIAKITFNNFHGVYIGIPIIVKYTGSFHNSDIEWTILSFDNRSIKIIDMILSRSPTKNDFILQ